MKINNMLLNSSIFVFLLLTIPSITFAHVVVKPAEVGIGAFQTFTVGVPVEKDIPTTQLRVVLPEGLNYVAPNVKQGWNIEVKKKGEGEEAKVTEIVWTGGSIPAGQRDEFLFSAQVPASETTVNWKAYQTYEDGTVVAWDKDPSTIKEDDHEGSPYSQTKVVNDLKDTKVEATGEKKDNTALTISIAALALSIVALGLSRKNK